MTEQVGNQETLFQLTGLNLHCRSGWGREDSPRTRFSGSLMLTVWSWEADKELLMERSAVGPMESAQDKALSRGSSHHRAWRPCPGVPGPRVTKGPQVQIPRGEETD